MVSTFAFWNPSKESASYTFFKGMHWKHFADVCVCAREFVSLLAVQNSQYKCELQCWTLSCSTQSLVLLCQDSRRAKGRDSSIQRTTRTSSRYISKHEWVNKGHQGSQLLKLQTHNARVVNRKGRWMLVASTSSDFFMCAVPTSPGAPRARTWWCQNSYAQCITMQHLRAFKTGCQKHVHPAGHWHRGKVQVPAANQHQERSKALQNHSPACLD